MRFTARRPMFSIRDWFDILTSLLYYLRTSNQQFLLTQRAEIMMSKKITIGLFSLLFLSFIIVLSGCSKSNSKNTENVELTSTDKERVQKTRADTLKPPKDTIEKVVLDWVNDQPIIPLKNQCPKNCSDNVGGKKPQKVKIVKMANPQEPSGNNNKYWPVRVEINGECDELTSSGRCVNTNFSKKEEFNIYKNDFGEWEAQLAN